MASTLMVRNVTVNGHRTSIKLEPDMWEALEEICDREGFSLSEICSRLDRRRRQSSLTAAVRVFIVGYYRALARVADPNGRSRTLVVQFASQYQ